MTNKRKLLGIVVAVLSKETAYLLQDHRQKLVLDTKLLHDLAFAMLASIFSYGHYSFDRPLTMLIRLIRSHNLNQGIFSRNLPRKNRPELLWPITIRSIVRIGAVHPLDRCQPGEREKVPNRQGQGLTLTLAASTLEPALKTCRKIALRT